MTTLIKDDPNYNTCSPIFSCFYASATAVGALTLLLLDVSTPVVSKGHICLF